jgi:hypothetical protein
MINKVLEAKFILKNSTWPTTSSYRQFYDMEKDSIDVLFFGSSVAVNAFIPQEIYNDYGIRSYNLGSEQQSIYLSYYWLREALRFQKPKVVVLDAKFMWDLHPEDAINTVESLTRKCLDPMKWSDVKMEAVHNLCELDENQSELSYYLTNIRFHSRWSGIQEYDLNSDMVDSSELKGFAPVLGNGPASYATYDIKDTSATVEFVPLMQEYLDKMVDLCKENDIRFVLVDLPGNAMNDGINNTHEAYAKEEGIDYYNLCSTRYYNQIGAVLPEESVIGHQNIWGAVKTSKFIGKLLKDQYGVEAVEDNQYESTKAYYEHTIKNANLTRITTQKEYLQAIKDPEYAVFFTAHGNSSAVLSQEDVQNGLKDLGLSCRFIDNPANSYVAAIVEGKVVEEESSAEKINFVGSFRNRHSIFTLQSSGINLTAGSSILIEGGQYSRNVAGVNIAVYDLTTNKVIDKVTFNGANVLR